MGRNGMAVVKSDNTNKEVVSIEKDTLEIAKLNAMINHKKEYDDIEQKKLKISNVWL